ncbi:MAG: pilus assembly protein PilP [Bdellovibrionaceae bacterium]|nr:pilus assembly protein PilP [Pseudobdellovibrionaceae bacterium]NUM57047.1 pilus assembly protein PilP [Pseudobdellovibrionaceae bacterium]
MKLSILILFSTKLLFAQAPEVSSPSQGAEMINEGSMIQATAPSGQNLENKKVESNSSLNPTSPPSFGVEIGAPSLIDESKKVFFYNESEGRDPFKPYREFDPTLLKTTDESTNVKSTNQEPAKETPMVRTIKTIVVPNDVILLGIVFNKQNPVAAVKVTEGKTYYLRKGDSIGRHEGKIIEINRDNVVIEQVKVFDGQKNMEKVILKFKKNEPN